MPTAFIGIGSNLGDRAKTIAEALRRLQDGETQVEKVSSLYETEPLEAHGPDFLNAVARVRTRLPPRKLLERLQTIELELGRTRPYKNAPRTIDLDILLYGDETVDEPGLSIPHPRMHTREFVLRPLLEIEPALRSRFPAPHYL